ncbi:MAG: hypothetical protein C0467_14440 [Planctomycetaceae bacterium]|nr:hypothetical protein [Planctomycetaceae bacterium]
MASRTLNHRALRARNDRAEEVEQETEEPEESPTPEVKIKKTRTRKTATDKPAKEKAAAKPRVRTRKAKVPPRMIARWAVCDGGLKRVAMFDYADRAAANSKLVEMQELKKGTFVLQLVKETYDPPAAIVPVIAV